MKKYLYEFGRRIVVRIIEKIKNSITKSESEYKNTVCESAGNKFTYEDYILRSRISVFKYRGDL